MTSPSPSTTNSIDAEVKWLKNEMIPRLLKDGKFRNANDDIMEVDKFKIKDVTVQFIGAQEAFMLTQCYRARIVYGYEGAAGDEEIKLFVKKSASMPEEIFEAVSFKALFNNEILAYETIIPYLEKFGKVSLNTTKFYYGDLQRNSAIVITEDFTSNGWQLTENKFNLSLYHTIMAMKYLAQFHALGFALRHGNKEEFEKLTQGLMEARYANDEVQHKWALTLQCGVERTIRSTRKYFKEIPVNFLESIRELLSKPMAYGRQLVKPKEPYVTLCHGDYLRNNLAYKYDEEGMPSDIMMFDLQTLRVSSPMLDLSILLSLSTLAELRYTYFRDIFGSYCQHLRLSYERIAQRPLPQYLRFNALLKEYIRFLPHSLLIASGFLLEMVEPHGLSAEQMLNAEPSDEEITNDIMNRGGDIVDRELAHQMKEIFELSMENNVNVFFN